MRFTRAIFESWAITVSVACEVLDGARTLSVERMASRVPSGLLDLATADMATARHFASGLCHNACYHTLNKPLRKR